MWSHDSQLLEQDMPSLVRQALCVLSSVILQTERHFIVRTKSLIELKHLDKYSLENFPKELIKPIYFYMFCGRKGLTATNQNLLGYFFQV